ncbi:EAL domain-containing protein [Pseudomonas sp. dw_358]|uniref:EAL domain-containing protein n=1 Tax=Pseudomonas sp. dw_358 TaxID=2720083 RepID=UPI001BD1F230|nr:EAL domain-containing protein [Pseudomonas sp. dw_358]
MRSKTIRHLTVAAAVLVFVTAVGTFAYLAVLSGRESARIWLSGIASDVSHRSALTAAQVNDLVSAQRNAGLRPCSPDHLALMQQLLLKAHYLQGLAYIQGNELLCSTLPAADTRLDLGPAQHITPRAGRRWGAVVLPGLPGATFTISERDGGYAAIIAPHLVLDISNDQTDISITHFRDLNGGVVRSKGPFDPAWLARYHGSPLSFSDAGLFVYIQPSTDQDTSMLVAVPDARVTHLIRAVLPGYLGVGIVLGLGLAALLFAVMRYRLSFKSRLLRALKRREFFLLYQPVMDLRTGECAGAEALIRWKPPEEAMISPVVFIPAAEASGLIRRVTAQVMEMVAQDIGALIKECPETHIGINLSAEDLHSEQTEQQLLALIRKAGGTPDNVMIEVTERGLMEPEKAQEVLVSIRAHGFKVAIDDFGTGNSSLSYLSTYTLDYLKIDKAFVDQIGDQRSSSPLLFHIIEIARSLGLKMIAEGVETEHQRNVLRDAGVHLAQGWYFARPMPIDELGAFIRHCRAVEAAGA